MNTSLKSSPRGEIVNNNQYTNVSEQEARCLAQIVQEMYRNSGIPYEVKQTMHSDRSPEASMTINHTGITFRVGLNCKTTRTITFTPKGVLK